MCQILGKDKYDQFDIISSLETGQTTSKEPTKNKFFAPKSKRQQYDMHNFLKMLLYEAGTKNKSVAIRVTTTDQHNEPKMNVIAGS